MLTQEYSSKIDIQLTERCPLEITMKRALSFLTLLVLLSAPLASDAAEQISSTRAAFHIGETIMVCGQVSDVAHLNKRTILNLGNPYPREEIGLLIWNSDLPNFNAQFGDISRLEGHLVCGVGTIEVYKQHLQMRLNNPTMLKLMKK